MIEEDKQSKIIQEIIRIAKEEVPFGEFKVSFKVHQGKLTGMREEHKERTTILA